MDRYDLELDVESEGGSVAHRASMFGGMFKKSTKSSADQSLLRHPQDDLSDVSVSDNNNYKDKPGGYKDVQKTKSTKDAAQNKDLGAPPPPQPPPRPPPRPGHLRRPSQDLLETDLNPGTETENTGHKDSGVFGMFKKDPKVSSRTQSEDKLLEATESEVVPSEKEKGGFFSGMFKKPKETKSQDQDDLSSSREELDDHKEKGGILSGVFKKHKLTARSQSKDDLEADCGELSNSQENLTDFKEKGGILSGVFKKPRLGARSQSKDDLGVLSNRQENLTDNKEKGGILSGVFKKPRAGARSQSKEDLTAEGELSHSRESLNETNKEKGGILSGVFKKPRAGARSQSKEDLTAEGELSHSRESLNETNKDKSGFTFGGMFQKQKGLGAKAQSQDDLSENTELRSSTENLTEKPSKGGVSVFLKNPFSSSAQKEDNVEKSEKNDSKDSEKPKAKQSGFSAMMKSTFHPEKQEKISDPETEAAVETEEPQSSHKQSKFAGAMTKLNPFRAGHKSEKFVDVSDEETPGDRDPSKQEVEKDQKTPVFEKRDRSETILEASTTSRREDQNKEMGLKDERRPAPETPLVPPRPTPEEMARGKTQPQNPEEPKEKPGKLYPTLNGGDNQAATDDKDEKPVKVKRAKHHNPFMPRTGAKMVAVETSEEATEAVNAESWNQNENEDKAEEQTKKPKRRNPFMPQVKNKGQRRAEEEEGANRTLFDRLEDFRFEPSPPETGEDVENLMEWWNTVENWEDTPEIEDMTPKEEAKAFAVTAEKIQKGIRVFNKVFSERAESLWQHVIDLNAIADGLDKFNKKTKIAQITGGSTSATGGVLTIAGLALAPVTMGTSLIVTAVGLGIATAGGLTSAGAGISNQVNNSMDRKKVEKIVEDYQEKMVDLNKALKFIKQGIENLRRFDLIKIRKQAYNQDFPVLSSRFYEDGAMAGKAILVNANEIMRVVQIANVAGSTAARAVQIASMATGVLTGLFVGMDIYFVAKDSKELKKGAKSEFAAKIREVAQQLHDGLVELNTIRDELQASTSLEEGQEGAGPGGEKGEKGEKGEEEEEKGDAKKTFDYDDDDDEEEDEIDRIKKQMKKDYENREWV